MACTKWAGKFSPCTVECGPIRESNIKEECDNVKRPKLVKYRKIVKNHGLLLLLIATGLIQWLAIQSLKPRDFFLIKRGLLMTTNYGHRSPKFVKKERR